MFQSSAGHKPGRYADVTKVVKEGECFNPRPGINPAATAWGFRVEQDKLFQSSAGHKPGRYRGRTGCGAGRTRFQSSAGHKPGRYPHAEGGDGGKTMFQSSAGHKPGRYVAVTQPMTSTNSFNPRPGINPAATLPVSALPPAALGFQSSAGHKPGRYSSSASGAPVLLLFQSSAGHKPGRYSRRSRNC